MSKRNKVDLKLVVATRIWANSGTEDVPLWKPIGGKDYIVKYFEYEPSLEEIGRAVDESRHMIEGGNQNVREILSGWQLYVANGITHDEYFQLNVNGSVDFPATDLTTLDISEEFDGTK